MSERPPRLSVVIASHGRREMLRRCLRSLCEQSHDPAGFEVIVACDGDVDGSATMAGALEAPFRLRVLSLPPRGQCAAQASAVEAASAPLLLLLDDDVIASPELVSGHLAGHRDGGPLIGIGPLTQRPPAGEDWYAHAFARGWNAHYESLRERQPRWTDCYGGNLSVPRSTLEAIGGVPSAVPHAFDFELALRLRSVGAEPAFFAVARGVHDDQKGWRRMLLDAHRQGAAYVELCRRFPGIWEELLLWRAATSWRELALRRVFVGLRLPAAALVRAGALLRSQQARDVWQAVVRRTALWQGARQALDRGEWRALTGTLPQ